MALIPGARDTFDGQTSLNLAYADGSVRSEPISSVTTDNPAAELRWSGR
jgi:prepilin-type processing-associated H-X9-DG protein